MGINLILLGNLIICSGINLVLLGKLIMCWEINLVLFEEVNNLLGNSIDLL